MYLRHRAPLALHPTNEQVLDFSRVGHQGTSHEGHIANRRDESLDFVESKKHKIEFRRNVNFFKYSTKQVMLICKAKPCWIIQKLKTKRENDPDFQRCNQEASHTKRTQGRETPIS